MTQPSSSVRDARRSHVVRVTGATLGYPGKEVLRDVSLTIDPGQFWFFLGPNGTGKTTMVRAILGTIAPMAGTIELNPAFSSRERIGFVPQRCDMSPSLPTTVREFVGLGLVGVPRLGRDEEERIAWALEKVGLEGREHADFHPLSGGQRQRVLVARALARHPRFLVADEPTSGLDPAAKARLLEVLAGLNRHERLTVVFVGHDLDVAADYATHVALFSRGTLLAGERAAVLTAQNLRDAYADAPAEPTEAARDADRTGGQAASTGPSREHGAGGAPASAEEPGARPRR